MSFGKENEIQKTQPVITGLSKKLYLSLSNQNQAGKIALITHHYLHKQLPEGIRSVGHTISRDLPDKKQLHHQDIYLFHHLPKESMCKLSYSASLSLEGKRRKELATADSFLPSSSVPFASFQH